MHFEEAMDFVQMRDGSSYVGEVVSPRFTIDGGFGKPLAIETGWIAWVIFHNDAGYPKDRIQLKDASELTGRILEDEVAFHSDATGNLSLPTPAILAIQLLSSFGRQEAESPARASAPQRAAEGILQLVKSVLRLPAPGVRMAIVDFGGTGVDPKSLPPIAAVLTKQAQQHFAIPPPAGYGISATIRAASGPQDVHPDEWVIGLLAKADQPNALGYHDQTPNGQPLIKVFPILDRKDGGKLSVTISHEVCETLADPNGARAAQWSDGKFWAYEVCDAVENTSYPIDDVPVSNFCLPPFFEPVKSLQGRKLDWMGLCKHPLEILPGGYGQWFDPAKGWQMVQNSQKPPRPYRLAVKGRSARRREAYKVAQAGTP
jgi:hypothetical protein